MVVYGVVWWCYQGNGGGGGILCSFAFAETDNLVGRLVGWLVRWLVGWLVAYVAC